MLWEGIVKTPPPISSQILQKNLLTTCVWRALQSYSSQRPKVPGRCNRADFQRIDPGAKILQVVIKCDPLFFFFGGGAIKECKMYGDVFECSPLTLGWYSYNDPLFKGIFTSLNKRKCFPIHTWSLLKSAGTKSLTDPPWKVTLTR